MSTGIASAASATKKSGAINDICFRAGYSRPHGSFSASPEASSLLPAAKILVERVIERLRGIEQRIVDAHFGKFLLQRLRVGVDQRDVLLAHRVWHDGHLLAAFEILERDRKSVV